MESKRPARGRPRVRTRRVPVTIHVTEEQRADLRTLADHRGVSIGQLLDEYAARRYAALGDA